MISNLNAAEEKLFIRNKEHTHKLLPICSALKLAGYETATIAEIMEYLQTKPELPNRFSIINNRYLASLDGLVYDLDTCKALIEPPEEPKKMAITFWI